MGFLTDPKTLSTIAAAIALLALAGLSVWISQVSRKANEAHSLMKELFKGKSHPDLEELLLNHERNIKILDRDIQELYNISNQINSLALSGIHKFASVRFNPFKDLGGDQSFSIALLNGKNDGIVITSLYTREGTRVYSKSIAGGESEKHPLTEEERQAVKLAASQGKKAIK